MRTVFSWFGIYTFSLSICFLLNAFAPKSEYITFANAISSVVIAYLLQNMLDKRAD